jgi:hypothetical protein
MTFVFIAYEIQATALHLFLGPQVAHRNIVGIVVSAISSSASCCQQNHCAKRTSTGKGCRTGHDTTSTGVLLYIIRSTLITATLAVHSQNEQCTE